MGRNRFFLRPPLTKTDSTHIRWPESEARHFCSTFGPRSATLAFHLRGVTTVTENEAPPCDACRRVPLAHLSLDVDEPVGGWTAYFDAKHITVMDDALGRPSVARHVLADLIYERKERERRVLEEAAQLASDNEGLPVPAGVPAREGLDAFETMMSAETYVSPEDEFRGFPRPSFLDEEFARTRQHQRAEAEVVRQRKLAKRAEEALRR
jgi:hypothetical protein